MIERIPASAIRDNPESVVGRTLVEFSHVGEDPRSPERRFDTAGHLGGELQIVAVRGDDEDNHVAILLDGILSMLWRDEANRAHRGHFADNGEPVFDDTEDWLMVPTDPPQGKAEVGFDENGWIEVLG